MNNIKKYIEEQFDGIRTDIKNQLDKEFDVDKTRAHLSSYLPKEVIFNSEILLETLLTYLMKEAKIAIEGFDVKTKNKFYDEKLNERFFEFANSLKEDKNLINNAIEFQNDPRKLNAIIASGTAFVAGTLGVAALSLTSIIGVIIAGIVVLAVSAFAYKFTYDKTASKARSIIRGDVENYLTETERKVTQWLEDVSIAFNKDLQNFINKNSSLKQISN